MKVDDEGKLKRKGDELEGKWKRKAVQGEVEGVLQDEGKHKGVMEWEGNLKMKVFIKEKGLVMEEVA